MPISPNSLTTTAVLAPSGRSRSARIRVVLPAPRKPVTTMTGNLGPRARRCRRPNSAASLPANGDGGIRSEVHFEGVEPSGVAVDGIDDAALVDQDVVDLDRPGRRPLGRRRDEIGD